MHPKWSFCGLCSVKLILVQACVVDCVCSLHVFVGLRLRKLSITQGQLSRGQGEVTKTERMFYVAQNGVVEWSRYTMVDGSSSRTSPRLASVSAVKSGISLCSYRQLCQIAFFFLDCDQTIQPYYLRDQGRALQSTRSPYGTRGRPPRSGPKAG